MDRFTEEEELDTIDPDKDYILLPSHPDYNKDAGGATNKNTEAPAKGGGDRWETTENIDTIDEPMMFPKPANAVPRVTGSVTLQAPPTDPTQREAEAPTREQLSAFQPDKAFRALKPVDEDYSTHLDELDKGARQVDIILSRKLANILTHVPQEYQARAITGERAKADRAKMLLGMKRDELGGEIYAKLDDNAILEADKLRSAGVDGVRAAKLADRDSKVEKLTGSILKEAAGNPDLHAALVEKLYGVTQRDEVTGEVQKDESGQPVRLGGLIKKTQYGTKDVTDEDELENLYKDSEANKAYRRDNATKRMREAGRGSSRGSSGSESIETPRLKALRGQASDVMGRINFLKEDLGDTYKNDPSYKDAADQLRATQTHISQETNFINASDNAEREKMGYRPLDTIPDQNADAIQKNKDKQEVYGIQAQNARLNEKVAKAAAGQNDADARTRVNEVKLKFAKDAGLEVVKPENNLDLVQQIARMGNKPQMFLFEGRVGAGTGLQAGVIDRNGAENWAKKYATVERKQQFEKQISQAESVSGGLRSQISRFIPDAEFDSKGFIETRNYGPHARLVANYNQSISDALVAGDELKAIKLAHRIATGKINEEEVQEPTSEFNEGRYNGSAKDRSYDYSKTKPGF